MKRGRVVAASAIGLALVVAIVIWVTANEILIERWFIWKLDSPDEQTRLEAARRLADMRSQLAVDHLLSRIRQGESGDTHRPAELLVAIGPFALDSLLEAYEEGEVFVRLRVLEVLRDLGERAAAAVDRIVEVKHEYLFAATVDALAAMGMQGARGLLDFLRDERHQLRFLAAESLAQQQPALRDRIESFAQRFDSMSNEDRHLQYSRLRFRILAGDAGESTRIGDPTPTIRT